MKTYTFILPPGSKQLTERCFTFVPETKASGESQTIDRIMSFAEAKPRANPKDGFAAYIKGAVHEAYAIGVDATEALHELRRVVVRNWQRIAECLAILTGTEVRE